MTAARTVSPSFAQRRKRSEPAPEPSAAVRGFLSFLAVERGLSQNTRDAYRRDLVDFEEFLTRVGIALAACEAEHVQAYLRRCSAMRMATKTVSRRLAAIRSLLRYQGESGAREAELVEGILSRLETPKPERSLPKTMSRQQVLRLIEHPDRATPLGCRDGAILELLYASGLRASELCNLKVADYNPNLRVIRVFGKGSKERVVPVGLPAAEAIDGYLATVRPAHFRNATVSGAWLFLSHTGRPLERVALWQIVTAHARASGVLGEVSTHTLRHCFATHLLGGGADLRVVQELLGHSDVGTTQIYTHVDADRLKEVHAQYPPRR